LLPSAGNRAAAVALPTRQLVQWSLKACRKSPRKAVPALVAAVETLADRGRPAVREAAVTLAQCLARDAPDIATAGPEDEPSDLACRMIGGWLEAEGPELAEAVWDRVEERADGITDRAFLYLLSFAARGAGLSPEGVTRMLGQVLGA
jgi:hypothetical protein